MALKDLIPLAGPTIGRILTNMLWWGGTGSGRFFDGAQRTDDDPRRPYSMVDIEKLLNVWTWRELVIGGRYLFQNFPVLTGATKEKGAFVIGDGWLASYHGKNQAWAEQAMEVMTAWFGTCDLRGQPYSFWYSFWIGCTQIEHSGDFFVILTVDDFENPRLLFIESHRIGQRFNGEIVPDGRYAGRKISNGVIYDGNGITPVAYRFINDGGTETDIDAQSIIHVFEPEWYTQGRGIPPLSHAMKEWDRVKGTLDAEQLNVEAASRINLIDYDATGKVDSGAAHVNKRTGADGKVTYSERITKGEIRHIMAGSGRKLEAFVANRPGKNTTDFLDLCIKHGFMGMEWPYEFGYKLTGLTGPAMRALTGKVQKVVSRRQRSLYPAVLRAYLYGLSKKMELGIIPPDEDWDKWTFDMPAEVSIDGGRDAAADLKEYEAGLTNAQVYLSRYGLKWRQVFRQRAVEASYKKELEKEFGLQPQDLGLVAIPPRGEVAPAADPNGGTPTPAQTEDAPGDTQEGNGQGE